MENAFFFKFNFYSHQCAIDNANRAKKVLSQGKTQMSTRSISDCDVIDLFLIDRHASSDAILSAHSKTQLNLSPIDLSD